MLWGKVNESHEPGLQMVGEDNPSVASSPLRRVSWWFPVSHGDRFPLQEKNQFRVPKTRLSNGQFAVPASKVTAPHLDPPFTFFAFKRKIIYSSMCVDM